MVRYSEYIIWKTQFLHWRHKNLKKLFSGLHFYSYFEVQITGQAKFSDDRIAAVRVQPVYVCCAVL